MFSVGDYVYKKGGQSGKCRIQEIDFEHKEVYLEVSKQNPNGFVPRVLVLYQPDRETTHYWVKKVSLHTLHTTYE